MVLEEIISGLRLHKTTRDQGELLQRALNLVRHVSGVQVECHTLMATLCRSADSLDHALVLLDSMKKYRVRITEDTYDVLLYSLAQARYLAKAKQLLREFQKLVAQRPPEAVLMVGRSLSALVEAFVEEDENHAALKLWDWMKEKREIPTTRAVSAIMRLHLREARQGNRDKNALNAVEAAFEYAQECGVIPDGYVYSGLIEAYLEGNSEKALAVLKMVQEKGIPLPPDGVNRLLSLCAKEGHFDAAESLLKSCNALKEGSKRVAEQDEGDNEEDEEQEAEEGGEGKEVGRNPGRDVRLKQRTVDDFITSYLNYEETERAFLALKGLQKAGHLLPTQPVLSVMLMDLAQKGKLGQAEEVYQIMAQGGRRNKLPDRDVLAAYMYSCTQAGRPEVALKLLTQGVHEQVGVEEPVNRLLHNALIIALSNESKLNEAELVQRMAKASALRPSEDAMTSLVKKYYGKNMHDKALSLLEEILAGGIRPGFELPALMLKSYTKMQDLDKALAVYELMNRYGVQHSGDSVHLLLSQCVQTRNIKKAVQILQQLKTNDLVDETLRTAELSLFNVLLEQEEAEGLRLLLEMTLEKESKGDDGAISTKSAWKGQVKPAQWAKVMGLAQKHDDTELGYLALRLVHRTVAKAERNAFMPTDQQVEYLKKTLDRFLKEGTQTNRSKALGVISLLVSLPSDDTKSAQEMLATFTDSLLASKGEEGEGEKERWDAALSLLELALREGVAPPTTLCEAVLHDVGVYATSEDEAVRAQKVLEKLEASRALPSGWEHKVDEAKKLLKSDTGSETRLLRGLSLPPSKLKDEEKVALLDLFWKMWERIERREILLSAQQMATLMTLCVERANRPMTRAALVIIQKMKEVKEREDTIRSLELEPLVRLLVSERDMEDCIYVLEQRERAGGGEGVEPHCGWNLRQETWDALLALCCRGRQRDLGSTLSVLKWMDERDMTPTDADVVGHIMGWCEGAQQMPTKALAYLHCKQQRSFTGLTKALKGLVRYRIACDERMLRIVLSVCKKERAKRNSNLQEKDFFALIKQLVVAQGLTMPGLEKRPWKEVVMELWESTAPPPPTAVHSTTARLR